MSSSHTHDEDHVERVSLSALRALSADEMAAAEAEIAACTECQRELDALRPAVAALVSWPVDVLRPPRPLWDRLARRIAAATGGKPASPGMRPPREADWEEVAPGISVKLLSTDAENRRVSMLVRLAPRTDYPPHRHAGIEELHLLSGELMINERKLRPGDYSKAEPGTVDRRVRSETGCTCVLVTSPDDVLR